LETEISLHHRGIALDYGLGDRRFESRQGLGIFLFITASGPALEPNQSPIQWAPRDVSVGVKRQRREADRSPPSSTEVKIVWSYISTPQYVFIAWCWFIGI